MEILRRNDTMDKSYLKDEASDSHFNICSHFYIIMLSFYMRNHLEISFLCSLF